MLSQSDVKLFKMFAELQINHILGGAMYFVVEGDTITWSISSENLKIEALAVGKTINTQSCSYSAINQKKTVTMKIPRTVYGTRIIEISIPVVDQLGEVVGAATVVFPRLHPVASAFQQFAPILSDMFQEGVFLYITDLEKCIARQASKKFEVPDFKLGYKLKETDIASKTIKTRKTNSDEIDASKWGVPILVMNCPLMDEDNQDEVVGTFGIVLPKGASTQLRDMSGNLNRGLNEVTAAIEQLASSASKIHNNEKELNSNIKDINELSENINEVAQFIKQIADQTKMLGLNASIEAARAGDIGRGFNVVAKEIRKLSDQSNNAVPKIRELTGSIKVKVDETIKISSITLESTQEQSAATEEITASIEEMTTMSEELNQLSNSL